MADSFNMMTNAAQTDMAALRRRAEADLGKLIVTAVPSLKPENVEALVHELRVHQIELQLQCEELQRTRDEVEESRDRYRELYESIPVGFVTIDIRGRIYDLNPQGAMLLGVQAKSSLRNFFFFFSNSDTDKAAVFCRQVMAQQTPALCELMMKKADETPFIAALQAAPVTGEGKDKRLRVVFQDVTRRHEAEDQLRRQQVELKENQDELRELTRQLFTAQEEERRRIACELHDDYCQRITAVILEVGSIARSRETSLAPRMNTLRETLVGLLNEFRHLSHELHPRNLDTQSIDSSLRRLVKEVSEYSRLSIEFHEENVPKELPMPIVVCLYRVLQESLSNIRKHANATSVTVRLLGGADKVTLQISDDGIGFETEGSLKSKKGIGLTSMQERVRPLGGQTAVTSGSGAGTTVTCTIPIPTISV